MNQTNLLKLSDQSLQRAKEIINELQIVETWQKFGAKANLVGSVRMGLMMKHLDIDFHIYSERFSVADSFAAIAAFAENSCIKHISYTNLIDTDEKCIEWHLWYHDTDSCVWQLDMIHILNDSPYAGYFERMADRISAVLTLEQKFAILSIKNEVLDSEHVMGVEIYQAVIRDGVRTYAEFTEWHKTHQPNGIVEWMP
ncbi:MAG: nucleotidyltransferase domain-containing protein [Bacteroidales bacterium]|nr:nucleotidyltransferase domain-containing protein [Bacteroidales bacterium]MDD3914889.1 nucleotidyltransferase domain-containing protein [Bacteroidales bacterium]MDD4634674.1 nucleotidyltransferase domain-containing protein [Bacteroidales bacterium]